MRFDGRAMGGNAMAEQGASKAETLIQEDKAHLWHHITQHKTFEKKDPFVVVNGSGCTIEDIRGNTYLDATAGGVWCVNAGYGRVSIAKAVCKQLVEMPYYSGSSSTLPAIRVASKLGSLLPELPHVFFSCSGSEANEKAFKIARQYQRLRHPHKDKYKILFRTRDYHGTTFGALSATGQNERTAGYGPFVPGFSAIPHACCYRCPFHKKYPGCNLECAHALETSIEKEGADTVGAVILEPITAGGGIIIPVTEYYDVIQEICRKYDVLLIIDEVVTGFGRTGKAFGHQHWKNLKPDVVTMAKGITSAYAPLSATVTTAPIFQEFLHEPEEKLNYFRDITTFGGSAGACAAAEENIRILEEEQLFANSQKIGRYLLDRLREFGDLPVIGEIRGKGLFVGIELVQDKESREPASEHFMARVVERTAEQGVLIGRMNRSVPGQNNVLELAPSLVLKKEEADRIAESVKRAIELTVKNEGV